MSMNILINTLIENIPQENIPKEIDLVLDGGAFNGLYMLGGLFYIKEMEKRNKIIVKRISGCSIGSALGILFLIDKMHLSINVFHYIYKYLRKHQDLKKMPLILRKNLYEILTEDNVNQINNVFYLTYFDTKKGKQIVKKKYKNKEDLIESIIKSMYVPYLIDRQITDKEGCVDGAFPYMFKRSINKRKILFLNLQSIDKIKSIIFIKNEKNIYPRIMEGLIDIHNFFEKNKSNKMCSYVNDWTLIDILFFRLREIVYTILIYLLRIGLKIDEVLPNKVKNDSFIRQNISIFKNIWRDIIMYLTI